MKRAEDSLIINIKELFKSLNTKYRIAYLDYFFKSKFESNKALVEIQDNQLAGFLCRTPGEIMVKGRILKASTIVFGSVAKKYENSGYFEDMVRTMVEELESTELISMANADYYEYLLPYGFQPIFKKNKYILTRDNLQRITNDGCIFDASAEDMLSIYSTFVKRFSGFDVRSLQDFENLKKAINSQGGRIVAFYENNQIKGYATLLIEGKNLYIDECIYSDSFSLFKLLNVALQQRHYVYLYVSEAEDLSILFDNKVKSELVAFKVARLNNPDLFNRLYSTNCRDILDVFDIVEKPTYQSMLD